MTLFVVLAIKSILEILFIKKWFFLIYIRGNFLCGVYLLAEFFWSRKFSILVLLNSHLEAIGVLQDFNPWRLGFASSTWLGSRYKNASAKENNMVLVQYWKGKCALCRDSSQHLLFLVFKQGNNLYPSQVLQLPEHGQHAQVARSRYLNFLHEHFAVFQTFQLASCSKSVML